MPRNKELMRIFRDLEMVEYLGSGIPRILKAYSKESFRFTENFTRMRFSSAEPSVGETSGKSKVETSETASETTSETTSERASETTSEKIVRLMTSDPETTIAEMSKIIEVTARSIERNIKALQDRGRIRRVGGDYGGHWEVLK